MLEGYISREAAVKAANEWASEACMAPVMRISRLFDKLQKVPAADVAPVVHGRWLHTDLAYHWTSLDECSVCGYHDEKRQHLGNYSYCPNCGAKMDGGAEDAAD